MNGLVRLDIENLITFPFVSDDEFGERTVSVLLDGEESEMIFIDHPSAEMSVSKHNSLHQQKHL